MNFKDICGHAGAIELLRESFLSQRLAKVYLFTGVESIGKRLVALEFARVLNCESGEFAVCGKCDSCLKISQNNHPDLHFIPDISDGSGQKSDTIKIEDIRNLQRLVNLRPYEGKFSVTVIDNAHNLSLESSNALLKTLEDTPGHSLIILVTHKPSLLLKTIISRCQVVRFFPLPRRELERILHSDYGFSVDLAHFVSFFSEGRLGFALSLNNPDILKHKNRIIDQLCLGRGYSDSAISFENRAQLRDCLNTVAAWLRDMYLIKSGVIDSQLINLDRKQELLKEANLCSLMGIELRIKFVSDSIKYLEHNINTKLLVSNLKAAMKG